MRVLKHWSINLIRGLSAIMLAIVLLINGAESIERFSRFLGIFWLIIGLTYLMNARADQKHRPLLMLLGVVTIFGGLVAFSWSMLTNWFDQSALTILAGLLILIMGVLHLFGGFPAGSVLGRKRDWGSLILGLLEIGLGISALANPGQLSLGIIVVGIFFSLLFGIILLFEAYRLRKRDAAHAANTEVDLES